MLAWGVEMHFSGGSQQGMFVQDSDFQAAISREAFQFLGEINFLGSEEFVAKPANFTEGRRVHEDEGSGHQSTEPAYAIPESCDGEGKAMIRVESQGAASC